MRPISLKLRERMNADPAMKVCIYCNADCCDEWGRRPGRAEWDHCFIYSGRQVNEWWAIVPCCWYHHRGGGMDKNFNKYRALKRMTDKDFIDAEKKYPKFNWRAELERLKKIWQQK